MPIKGQKRDHLHLIDEAIAVANLPSKKIDAQRLVLGSKPYDVFILVAVPTVNLDNTWNESAVQACEDAKTLWTMAASQKGDGHDSYAIEHSRRVDAFPEPKWPKISLDEIITAAFHGRMIESDDHPGLLRLVGAMIMPKFGKIIVCDFEYEIADGDLPDVLRMADMLDDKLQHVRTIRLWRGEFGSKPPFDIGDDAVFVCYSAWAEMTCFMQLGWKFPVHIFDQHTCYFAASNVLLPHSPDEVRKKPKKNLTAACRAYDIHGWSKVLEALSRTASQVHSGDGEKITQNLRVQEVR